MMKTQTELKKALLATFSMLGFLLYGCNQNSEYKFNDSSIESAKRYVTEEIANLYVDTVEKSLLLSKCKTYQKMRSLLASPEAPEVLKWQEPMILLSNSEMRFVFFAPRPRPLLDFCTDNCLKAEDITVTIYTYEVSAEGADTWTKNDDAVLWNGKWVYRVTDSCENIVF